MKFFRNHPLPDTFASLENQMKNLMRKIEKLNRESEEFCYMKRGPNWNLPEQQSYSLEEMCNRPCCPQKLRSPNHTNMPPPKVIRMDYGKSCRPPIQASSISDLPIPSSSKIVQLKKLQKKEKALNKKEQKLKLKYEKLNKKMNNLQPIATKKSTCNCCFEQSSIRNSLSQPINIKEFCNDFYIPPSQTAEHHIVSQNTSSNLASQIKEMQKLDKIIKKRQQNMKETYGKFNEKLKKQFVTIMKENCKQPSCLEQESSPISLPGAVMPVMPCLGTSIEASAATELVSYYKYISSQLKEMQEEDKALKQREEKMKDDYALLESQLKKLKKNKETKNCCDRPCYSGREILSRSTTWPQSISLKKLCEKSCSSLQSPLQFQELQQNKDGKGKCNVPYCPGNQNLSRCTPPIMVKEISERPISPQELSSNLVSRLKELHKMEKELKIKELKLKDTCTKLDTKIKKFEKLKKEKEDHDKTTEEKLKLAQKKIEMSLGKKSSCVCKKADGKKDKKKSKFDVVHDFFHRNLTKVYEMPLNCNQKTCPYKQSKCKCKNERSDCCFRGNELADGSCPSFGQMCCQPSVFQKCLQQRPCWSPFQEAFSCRCNDLMPMNLARRRKEAAGDCFLMSLREPPQPCFYDNWPSFLTMKGQCTLLGRSLLLIVAAIIWSPCLLCLACCYFCCCADCRHCC